MSIRVNKRIGYGLTDLHTKSRDKESLHTPNDPRWDYGKYKPDRHGDPVLDCGLADFISWCEGNKDKLEEISKAEGISTHSPFLLVEGLKDRLRRKDFYQRTVCNMLEWDSECGLKGVLLFTPFEQAHDWIRHDDIMDYYEEQGTEGLRRRATPIKGFSGIYPYDGTMKRFRLPTREVSSKLSGATNTLQIFHHAYKVQHGGTPEIVDGAAVDRMGGESYNGIVGAWRKAHYGDTFADPNVQKHFREDWRPTVPLGVLAIIEYLGCFPDAFGPEGIVNSLRPLIYVWWG